MESKPEEKEVEKKVEMSLQKAEKFTGMIEQVNEVAGSLLVKGKENEKVFIIDKIQ